MKVGICMKKQNIYIIVAVITLIALVLLEYIGETSFSKNGKLGWLLAGLFLEMVLELFKQGLIIGTILFFIAVVLKKTKALEFFIAHFKYCTIGFCAVIFIVNLFVARLAEYDMYEIDGKKISNLGYIIRIVKDITTDEYMEIKVKRISYDHKTESTYSRTGTKTHYVYYAIYETEDGSRNRVCVYRNANKIQSLIYDENSENKLTIHKNTGLIKAVNGIDLFQSDESFIEKRNEEIEKQKNKVRIKYTVTAGGKGYTYNILDNYIADEVLNSYESKLQINFMDYKGKLMLGSGTKDRMANFQPSSKEGVYYFYVVEYGIEQKIISNTIKCTVDKSGNPYYEDVDRYDPTKK